MTEHLGPTGDDREGALEAIARLDRDHADGLLDADEYRGLRAELVTRAAEALRIEAAIRPASPSAGSADHRRSKPRADSLSRNERPARRRRNRRSFAVLGAAFVALVLLAMANGVGDRLDGEAGTGDIEADSPTLLARARQQTAAGDAADAVRTYDAVLKRSPQNVEALAYRGWLVRLAGLPAEGLVSIEQAVAIDPGYPDARFFRGLIFLRDQQKPAAAVEDFDAFLANNPPTDLVPLVQQARNEAVALNNLAE